MRSAGLGPVAVVDVRGIKFGFIGFNGVGHAIDQTALKAGIQRARQLADIVVVQIHWGKEYERQPTADRNVPTPDDPVVIGHESIDWGADIVNGKDSRTVLQTMEAASDQLAARLQEPTTSPVPPMPPPPATAPEHAPT